MQEEYPGDVLLEAWAHRLDLPEESEEDGGHDRHWWTVIGASVLLDVVSALFPLARKRKLPNSYGIAHSQHIEDASERRAGAEGSVHLGEIDVLHQKDEVRKTFGYLPQAFGVYPRVSAEKLLDHFALLKGIAGRWARCFRKLQTKCRMTSYNV